MKPTHIGILLGAVLALTWIEYGFWAFFFVALAVSIGALVGRFVEGKLDPGAILDAVKGKRSSS